jgi:bifunctional non-homologous end joining protein LigD
MKRTAARVGERTLWLSNLEKDLYPSYGFTKADVLDYYRQISPYILPHLKGRALTLKRYPDGTQGEYFFEKRCPGYRPGWVETASIPQSDGVEMTVCLVNSLDTLMWVENLASLELHVPLAKAATPMTPDSIVFDLDPGEGADVVACGHIALMVRDILSDLDLECCIKTSGKKGLHVYVPLNDDKVTFEDTRRFSRTLAEVLQRNYPQRVTSVMAREARKGRVFINWSQNGPSNTTVCAYSLRAGERPTVSLPLTWEELEGLTRLADPEKFQFIHSDAIEKTEKDGDLFAALLDRRQTIPHL